MAARVDFPSAIPHGHTLFEMVLVISILALAATVALSGAAPNEEATVDVAAYEVVHALRFAQTEAMRTNSYRVAGFDPATNRVHVFALNLTPIPPVEDTVSAVNHPISKKKYDFLLTDAPSSAGVRIASSVFNFLGAPAVPQLAFTAEGLPVNVRGTNPAEIDPLVGTGQVQIVSGSLQRTVFVDAATGRVTLSF